LKPIPATTVASAGTLGAYGFSEDVAQRLSPFTALGLIPARLVRVDRGGYIVATSRGIERCHPTRGELQPDSATGPPVTGDWVAVQREPGFGLVLQAITHRTTVVRRLDPHGTTDQVLVANIDAMFVLHGLDRPHRVGRIERCCILAWDAGATPTVLLTKSDLLDTGGAVIDLLGAIERIHSVIPGVDVLPVSSTTGSGVDQLRPILRPGTTVGLIGESGSGKSTLINYLVGAEVQATGETRAGDAKGKHTTTSRSLLPAPGGAVLVDMPGIRTIGMADNRLGVSIAHQDIESLFEDCKFRDCGHGSEPGCAVRGALDSGTLDGTRWRGYLKLQKELVHEARRADQRARRAEERSGGRRYRKMRKGVEEW
jgi:ribosome biogenesis GTPase